MSDERAFRGVWIPAEVWLSRTLTLQEKVMLVEIDSLQHPDKGCFKSNKRLAEFFGLSANRVSEIISSLKTKGWVRVEQIRRGKQIVERRIFMSHPLSRVADIEAAEDAAKSGRDPEGGYSESRVNPTRNPEGGYSENGEERGSGLGVDSLSDASAANSSAGAASVFEQAATAADDGGPAGADAAVPRKTAMTLDWQPEPETYRAACWQRGVAPDADASDALIDFREHFADQPHRTNTHAAWTRRFVRWVAENAKRKPAAPQTTGGNSHADRRRSTSKRRLTAQEARAAAEGRAPAAAGNTLEGEWTHGHG